MITFEYNNQLTPQNILDIEDIGQCALECIDDKNSFYYLIIRTSLGVSTIFTCGPIDLDINLLPSGYSMSLFRMSFNDKKLVGTINKFLNDGKNPKVNAKCVEIDYALNNCRDLISYMNNYGKECY